MPAVRSEFVDHLLELLQPWKRVVARRMFGGYGIYADDLMIGLVADDTLYFKVDAQNRADFEAAGSTPFVYAGKGTSIEVSYWSAPSACFESPAEMAAWAALGYAAALRAAAARRRASQRSARAAAKSRARH